MPCRLYNFQLSIESLEHRRLMAADIAPVSALNTQDVGDPPTIQLARETEPAELSNASLDAGQKLQQAHQDLQRIIETGADPEAIQPMFVAEQQAITAAEPLTNSECLELPLFDSPMTESHDSLAPHESLVVQAADVAILDFALPGDEVESQLSRNIERAVEECGEELARIYNAQLAEPIPELPPLVNRLFNNQPQTQLEALPVKDLLIYPRITIQLEDE